MARHLPPQQLISVDDVVRRHPDLHFIVSHDGTILHYYGGPDADLYVPPEMFIGRTLHDVLPAPVASQIAEGLGRVRDTSRPFEVEYTLPLSGEERRFEARLMPLGHNVLAICRDVSETYRTQERLRTTEARLRKALSLAQSTLDATADGILVVDRSGRVVTFNRRFVEMWQLPSDIVDTLDDGLALASVVDQLNDPSTFLTKVHELNDSSDTESFDVLEFKDGRTFEGHSRPQMTNAQWTGRVWSFRDITSQRRADAALHDSERRFRQIAEAIDQVIWLADAETGRVLYVSPAFESIWGRPSEELYANPHLCHDTILDSDRARVVALQDSWLRKNPTAPLTVSYPIAQPSGAIRWVLDTMTPIRREDGTLYRLGGVAKDITTQREAELTRRHLEAQLVHAHRMEAIGTLAAGVAHNFNNALAIIIGNAELARVTGADDRKALDECLGMVMGASARAQTLVQQLLTFARQSATELRPENLGPVVERAVDVIRPTLPPLVQVAVRVDPDVPSVLADVTQIQQVVTNLVTNAAHAMQRHAGTIAVALERFDATPEFVETEPDLGVGPYARLTVNDGGLGMDDTTRRRLFEPFFTTGEPATTLGLGLSVVHGVTRRHGGAIRIWSEQGGGTRFELYFPARDLPVNPRVDRDVSARVSLELTGLVALRSHPNLMLTGTAEATESVLDQVRAALLRPVREYDCAVDLSLPSDGGTAILRHVASLDSAQQLSLLRWLDAHVGNSQVVSVATEPLFPLVERDVFLGQLFYRLNTVHLLCDSELAQGSRR